MTFRIFRVRNKYHILVPLAIPTNSWFGFYETFFRAFFSIVRSVFTTAAVMVVVTAVERMNKESFTSEKRTTEIFAPYTLDFFEQTREDVAAKNNKMAECANFLWGKDKKENKNQQMEL